VVTNPLIRVASNFIMRMNKNPQHRMFATEAEAVRWLDERSRAYAQGAAMRRSTDSMK
jgi:hypothetical protein